MTETKLKIGDKVVIARGGMFYPQGTVGTLEWIETGDEQGLNGPLCSISSLDKKFFLNRLELVKETPVKTFDPTKPVQTRDGRKARIVCTDRLSKEGFNILALVTQDGVEFTESYTSEGKYNSTPGEDCRKDLVNIPEKRWVNLYEKRAGDYFKTEDGAKRHVLDNSPANYGKYIKTVEVELG